MTSILVSLWPFFIVFHCSVGCDQFPYSVHMLSSQVAILCVSAIYTKWQSLPHIWYTPWFSNRGTSFGFLRFLARVRCGLYIGGMLRCLRSFPVFSNTPWYVWYCYCVDRCFFNTFLNFLACWFLLAFYSMFSGSSRWHRAHLVCV